MTPEEEIEALNQQNQATAQPQTPILGQLNRRIADIKVGELDFDWSRTQYAAIANNEAFDDFFLSDLINLAGLPVITFDDIQGDPYLSEIDGVDWSMTNYDGLTDLQNIKLSQIGEAVVVDPVVKNLPSIAGTYLETAPLVTGISPLPMAEGQSFNDAIQAWFAETYGSAEPGTEDYLTYQRFLDNYNPEDFEDVSVAKYVSNEFRDQFQKKLAEARATLNAGEELSEEQIEQIRQQVIEEIDGDDGKGKIVYSNLTTMVATVIPEIPGQVRRFFNWLDGDADEEPQIIEDQATGQITPRPQTEKTPLRFSQLDGTVLETAEVDFTTQKVVDSIMELTPEEQKLLAENIFINMPDVYTSWESVYREDGTLNTDTFVPALRTALADAQEASAFGLSQEYLEMFMIDDLTQLEKNEIRVEFQRKIAEAQAKDNMKNVTLVDPAALHDSVDDYFKKVTGRGATDTEVREFVKMFNNLTIDATPTAKELREGGFTRVPPNLAAQSRMFAEEQAPVEAKAMQTANKASLIMQALGMGG